MIDLYNAETNQLIGSISDADLQILTEALEEESTEDQDYYIDEPTIEMLAAEGGASADLVGLLRSALGSADGIDVRWERR